jgi:hypothetical protein
MVVAIFLVQLQSYANTGNWKEQHIKPIRNKKTVREIDSIGQGVWKAAIGNHKLASVNTNRPLKKQLISKGLAWDAS